MEHHPSADRAKLLFFLHYLARDKPGTMYGSHKVEDVLDAACRLTGVDQAKFKMALLGIDPNGDPDG